MNTYRHSRNSMNFLFSMLLFLVFILCCIFTILIGSRVYTNIRARNNDAFYSDTALSYLSNKVRQADRSDGISVEEENGQSILLLRSETDGTIYETRIYEKDGTLMELFAEKDSGLTLDAGTPVMECRNVSFTLSETERSSLLTIALTQADGSVHTAVFSLRSTKGGTTP